MKLLELSNLNCDHQLNEKTATTFKPEVGNHPASIISISPMLELKPSAILFTRKLRTYLVIACSIRHDDRLSEKRLTNLSFPKKLLKIWKLL